LLKSILRSTDALFRTPSSWISFRCALSNLKVAASRVQRFRHTVKVKKGYTPFLPGDVIVAKITPCMENGKMCVVPELSGAACFGSTEFHVVRTEDDIDPRWVANFLLQHSTRHAAKRQMMGGVGQMRVPSSFVESLKIPVPPKLEQQRILDTLDELLSDLSAGVATLERVKKKLKHYRAAVLKAAVEGELTADWRAQHHDTEPACELLQRILVERRRRWEEAQIEKFKAAGREPPKDWKARYQEPIAPDTRNLPVLPEGWCWASTAQIGENARWASEVSQTGTDEKSLSIFACGECPSRRA
jgi:type I restriction enzyme S subunit